MLDSRDQWSIHKQMSGRELEMWQWSQFSEAGHRGLGVPCTGGMDNLLPQWLTHLAVGRRAQTLMM